MKTKLLPLTFCLLSLSLHAQVENYTAGTDKWNTDSLGNHRAVIVFNGSGNVAKARIVWRRRDYSPQDKRIIVEDAKTHSKVLNVKTGTINREFGDIYFEPTSGNGNYYVYYMPYKNEGRSNYPKGTYLKPEATASEFWTKLAESTAATNASVKEIQAINAFNSFYPMEVIATAKETANIKTRNSGKAFIVFPEDREFSVRMQDDLPYRWIQKGVTNLLAGKAARGENYTYQLGVYALKNINDVQVKFTDLKSSAGKIIQAKNSICINTNGTTYDAKPLVKQVSVLQGKVQPLWCALDIPKNAAPGSYSGKAIVTAKGETPVTIDLMIAVTPELKLNGGIDEPWKMTRLEWLNSTIAQDNQVIKPYTALQVQGNTISLLGRKVTLSADGFPSQIATFFTPEMTAYQQQPNNILASPMHFVVSNTNDKSISFKSNGLLFTKKESGTVEWKSSSKADKLKMDVSASLEFDGFVSYHVTLIALEDVSLSNTSLQIPFNKVYTRYMMGLGQKGGYRPSSFNWKWDVPTKNQDGAWIGNVSAGLQFSLRDEKYVRPLNTNFYLQKPLLLPTSWGNSNKGGINISEEGSNVLINNYSGERLMRKGDSLYYNFTLLITPFHPINTDFQWQTRFFHSYKPIDTIKATGATVANIHHATEINPWINYPFIEHEKMKAYIDEAHAKGLKVKIYNTVRELSNHAYETFALRSLGTEIYSPGKGGGFSWLQEHLDSNYIAAWFVPEIKDAAIVNSGMSRWHNYYVEGMNWLVQQVGIDGIYLDDVAFDRVTMKRIKRVLTQGVHPGIIDLHSANQYNKSDGFNNSANLYMEHFPYLNRLWFGEYFDYEKNTPDFFLTEVSGIPFGLMGEMLQDGGNAWRGMIYGMTNRMPWSDNADPRPLWKAWDEFGMQGSNMIGYWSENCPVKTTNDKVLATVYKKKVSAMVSVASWADNDTQVQLIINWKKLGIDPSKATITAREIKNFQPAQTFLINQSIPIKKGEGWLLTIQ
jgi:hypothetical protein